MGEADEHQVQYPPQVHDPQDRIQHAAEDSQLHFTAGGMSGHPNESGQVICQGEIFSPPQMLKQ